MGVVEADPARSRIIALDTTSEYGSIALSEGGVVIEEIELHSTDGFGHLLFGRLDELMRRHGWTYDSVAGFAAGAGPGSFTGVRVGLAAVKGLAEACGAKAAAVSNLQAMAVFGRSAVRAPFFDARRGEIYGGVFDAECSPLADETVCMFADWRESLPAGAELLCQSPESFGVEATKVPRALAPAIAKLAPACWADPIELDANYVRRSDGHMKWTDR
jgi:tRNA threonylcarbamoyladenosine biosynthesis protein TsaB